MKRILTVIFCMGLATISILQANSTTPGVSVSHISPQTLALQLDPVVRGVDTIVASGKAIVRPRIDGAVQIETAGNHELWVLEIPVAVPASHAFALSNVAMQTKLSPEIQLPVVKDRMHAESYDATPSHILGAYSELGEQFSPSISYLGVAGHTHVAKVVIPVLYMTQSGVVQVEAGSVNINMFDEVIAPERANRSIPGIVYPLATIAPNLRKQESAKKVSDAVLSSTQHPWVKVTIDERGVYRVTADELSDAGLEVPNDLVDYVQVYSNGGHELPERIGGASGTALIEQQVYVTKHGNGSLKEIVFFGNPNKGIVYNPIHGFRPWQNAFSKNSHYMITIGESLGKRAAFKEVPSEPSDIVSASVSGFSVHEKDLFNPYSPGSGRRWFGEAIDKSIPTTFVTTLPGLVGQGEVEVVASLAHTDVATSQISIEESGQELAPLSMSRVFTSSYEVAYAATAERQVPASSISGNQARLQLQYTSGSGSLSGSAYVDWFMYQYPRSMRASNQELFFGSAPNQLGIVEMVLSDFGTGTIYGFDISDMSNPVAIENLSSTGGLFKIKEEITQPQLYFVSSRLKTPAAIASAETSALRSVPLNADVVVITHSSLMESAQRYHDYREESGEFEVAVVDIEHVYNEYGYGSPDPGAIRDFLADALATWERTPRYVVLWGDGHYDYKGITTSVPNLIPTWQNYDKDGKFDAVDSTYLTEDFFTWLNGDDTIPDIAIGRIAVNSNELGNTVVDRIIHYEVHSSVDDWRARVTLVADDSWAGDRNDQGLHTGQSEDLSNNALYIPRGMKQKKIYLPEFATENIPGGLRKPKVNQALVNAINSGAVLLNWIGHGNPKVWAHERIFLKDETVPLFRNYDKLFFLTAATCDFGRFDDIENRSSGAEDLMHSSSGGAIGVFSAARTVYALENAIINEGFYTSLFTRTRGQYARLGDALLAVKVLRHERNDQKYFLLGDPVMRLQVPQMSAEVTHLNGVEVTGQTEKPLLKALATVSIAGVIRDGFGNIDSTFNGTALVNLFDSDIDKRVEDIDGTIHNYWVNGGLLSIAAARVENGVYSAEFVVPKDISFSNSEGRLYIYAFDEDSVDYAIGATQEFIVGGIEDNAIVDNQGPVIDVYLDTRQFQSGDVVGKSPLLIVDLEDESGINATGNGIGHDIQAWIGTNPESISLTSEYSVSFEDFRRGSATRQLFDLPCGDHFVKVRAWDVYNNYSEKTTFFTIDCEDRIVVNETSVYPNPFTDVLSIEVRHNSLDALEAQLYIYSLDGRLIYTSPAVSGQSLISLSWNGLNNTGISTPEGMFVYKVHLTGNGNQKTVSGTVVKLVQ